MYGWDFFFVPDHFFGNLLSWVAGSLDLELLDDDHRRRLMHDGNVEFDVVAGCHFAHVERHIEHCFIAGQQLFNMPYSLTIGVWLLAMTV
jgi:hypothetical protein